MCRDLSASTKTSLVAVEIVERQCQLVAEQMGACYTVVIYNLSSGIVSYLTQLPSFLTPVVCGRNCAYCEQCLTVEALDHSPSQSVLLKTV